MRSLCQLSIVLGIFMLALTLQPRELRAQDVPTSFARTDYMDVHNVEQYLEIERTWKTLHERLIQEGIIVYWGLYRVDAPFGSSQPYSYVTVQIYPDFAKMENPYPTEIVEAVIAGFNEEQQAAIANPEMARDLMKSEYYRLVNWARGDTPVGPYLLVDYMDTPENGDAVYEEVEAKYWKPIHAARISKGMISGWDLWSRMFTGANDEYDHATVNAFNSFAQLAENQFTEEVINAAYPNMTEADLQKMLDETVASRSLVRSQLWTRIDFVAAPTP